MKTSNRYNLEDKHINGYFLHIASSRSGHNFIKNNILEYLNDEKCQTRKYLNLEGYTPSRYLESLEEHKLSLDNINSVYILTLRDLMNWYSSITHFILRNLKIENGIVVTLSPQQIFNKRLKRKQYENKILVTWEDVNKNRELLFDSSIVIVENKEEYLKKQEVSLSDSNIEDFLDVKIKKLLNIWLEQAKEFKGETKHMPYFSKIYYDEFVKSKEYRKSICNQINGVYSENMLNTVPISGGGSSFDFQKYINTGSTMKVLERYKQWQINGLNDPSIFLKFLKNHEAYKFYLDNFEVDADKKRFIDNIK